MLPIEWPSLQTIHFRPAGGLLTYVWDYTRDLSPCQANGAEGIRTPDLFLAKEAFSQLNYGPALILDFKLGRSHSIQNLKFRVGLPGIEPETSVLSGLRSNQLS